MKILTKIEKHLFALLVVLPSFVVSVYVIFLADHEYDSAAAVIIKENNRSGGPMMPGIAGVFFDHGNRTSIEDGYLIREFLKSDSFLVDFGDSLGLVKHFTAGGFPYIQRMSDDVSDAEMIKYLRSRLSVAISKDSAILNIAFRAFDPKVAKLAVDYIIEKSEERINRISDRMVESRLSLSSEELMKAEKELRAAKDALLRFQVQSGWLNPDSEISSHFQQIVNLRSRFLDLVLERERLLVELRSDSPQVINLDSQIGVIRTQLSSLEVRLIGESSESDIQLSSVYSNLSLDLEFAQSKYRAATAALQQAQMEAGKQAKFLLVVSPSYANEKSSYPKPLRSLLTAFVVSMLMYLLVRLIVATIKDHTV